MHLGHDQTGSSIDAVDERWVVVVAALTVALLLLIAATSVSWVDRAVVLLDFDPVVLICCWHVCRICFARSAAFSACCILDCSLCGCAMLARLRTRSANIINSSTSCSLSGWLPSMSAKSIGPSSSE